VAGKPIYLDYAAATPLDETVLAAMQPYFSAQFYNPSATYGAARGVHQALSNARAGVAGVLGARPSEIIFTAGGTEANNLAIHGVMSRFKDGNLVVSAIEHESVLEPARRYDCRQAAVGPDGRLDLDDLAAKIDDNTVLVSVMYANNEIGTVEPLRDVSRLVAGVRERRRKQGNDKPLYLHTDAAQAGNYLDLHVSRLGVDMMTINGGKIYGPKQSGALYVKAGLVLEPLVYGGGQERGLRSGTENVAGAIGLAQALELAQAGRREESERLIQLQQQFIDGLCKTAPEIIINGSRKYRLPNNVHITVPGRDNERLLIQLDEAGVQAAAGSACSASNEEPSHVLKALGVTEKDAQASLRFTLGRHTTPGDIEKAVRIFHRIYASA
jgi:cysteine desulfurase